jgi:hypothetical protein
MFKSIRFAVLLAGVTLAFTALAQPAPDDEGAPGPDPGQTSQGPTADPPTRVARLAFIRGNVSFVPAGENDWVEAPLNRPLITGDKLWTDSNSRTELEIGSATMRMDQNTSFDFLNLDDKTAQVELTQGTLDLRVRRLYDNQTYEIDTPTLAFVINRVGEYRVDVQPDGAGTVVSVLHGGGDTYGEGGARFRVEEGQSVTFHDAQLQNYQSGNLPPPDDFTNFCAQRDGRWDHAKSRQYVSEDVIGYQDLDDNGAWDEVPEYGNVWYPSTVAVGWSPYHYGHWGWVGAYGWSWIDDAPWGFAPFHYGRWAYIGNRWGWCPGRIEVRAVYAPALVAFVGGGVGVSIGFGSGPVGWFPLGPRDVYYPGYHVSQRYFANINISGSRGFTNVTINNYYGNYSRGHVDFEHINYANRNVNGAVVAVPAAAFVGARPVAGAAIAVNNETFAHSRVSGFAAVAPTRASLAPGVAARAMPPAAVVNRPVVAATRPPAPVASFAQRQTLLQKNPGQPLRENQLHAPVAANASAVGAAGGRQNLHVVTAAGAPARTAAPALPARSVGAAANTHVAPGGESATTHVNSQGNNAAIQTNRTNVPSREAGVATQVSPAVTGRPAANAHVDSARFAHPAATTGAPGNNPGNGVQPSRAATTTSHGAVPAVQNNAASNSELRTNRTAVQTQQQHNAVSSSNTSVQGKNSVQGKPEYRQVQSHTPQTTSTPRVNSSAQEYHAPPPTNNNHPAPQAYHTPQVQTQTQTHSNPQYQQAAPASSQMMQRTPPPTHVAPPPPQQQQSRAPQQQQHAPPPPKEKKDDDKRHGGR